MDEKTETPRFIENDEGIPIPTQNTVTLASIEGQIQQEHYHVFPGTTKTVCCLVLANGYDVTGEAACADPDNFNEKTGRHYARKDAISKIWPLEGYLLRQRLHEEGAGTKWTGDK